MLVTSRIEGITMLACDWLGDIEQNQIQARAESRDMKKWQSLRQQCRIWDKHLNFEDSQRLFSCRKVRIWKTEKSTKEKTKKITERNWGKLGECHEESVIVRLLLHLLHFHDFFSPHLTFVSLHSFTRILLNTTLQLNPNTSCN